MTFKEYLKLDELTAKLSVPLTVNIPSGVYGALPTTWTGSQAVPMPNRAMPSGGFAGSIWNHQQFDLKLPTTSKTAQISHIEDKKNPIAVYLNDGTKLFFPPDAYKKIVGPEPSVGRTMTVVFQRRKEDMSNQPAKIIKVYCF